MKNGTYAQVIEIGDSVFFGRLDGKGLGVSNEAGWGGGFVSVLGKAGGATECGKELNKEIDSPAVVAVVAGKVEKWRMFFCGLELN
jgi:hypothetical protein